MKVAWRWTSSIRYNNVERFGAVKYGAESGFGRYVSQKRIDAGSRMRFALQLGNGGGESFGASGDHQDMNAIFHEGSRTTQTEAVACTTD
jgi:hypothetical protein